MNECFDFMDTNGSQCLLSPNSPVGSNRLLLANSTQAVKLDRGKVAPHSWINPGMKRVSGFETYTISLSHTHTHSLSHSVSFSLSHTHTYTHIISIPSSKPLICRESSWELEKSPLGSQRPSFYFLFFNLSLFKISYLSSLFP